eukprot:TRINITY_DN3007_c0_g1_i1.p1 TRINITY_DN3007_c0_g1~~TRINITY_DN3007_c0_g1_i1.p1  ORF type:complete len:128 (-),score=15.20 TRINITY_DN3007_c0_g1_i1:25-408(-)
MRIANTNLCAISGLVDACREDSGGGLLKESRRGGYTEIVGVVSYGYGCRSTLKGVSIPGVYTRVSSVVKWIQRQTASGRSCRKPSFVTHTPSTPSTPTSPTITASPPVDGWESGPPLARAVNHPTQS